MLRDRSKAWGLSAKFWRGPQRGLQDLDVDPEAGFEVRLPSPFLLLRPLN